jgi:hypothetical protein
VPSESPPTGVKGAAVSTHSDDPVLSERIEGHITLITLNRPERRNAVDGATARAI